MHRRSCKHISPASRDEGSVIVLTAISLLALFTTIALAIDAGNLYRARLALQRAADAAAIATVNYVTVYGKLKIETEIGIEKKPNDQKKTPMSEFLLPKAREIVNANLAIAGFPADLNHTLSVEGEYRPRGDPSASSTSAFEYSVTVKRPISYYLMGVFSGQRNIEIATTAVARRKIANVSLVLDVSSSMRCPAKGDCSCLSPGRTGPCASPTRMDNLLDGVKKFLTLFDLNADRIAVVPFNITAEPLTVPQVKDLYAAETGEVINDITIEGIENIMEFIRERFVPSSISNVCDGLMRAQSFARHPNGQNVPPMEDMAYLLFSDGNPTAGRFLFNDRRHALEAWPSGSSTYDYTHYSVEWVNTNNGYVTGPSVLVRSNVVTPGAASSEVYLPFGHGLIEPLPGGKASCLNGVSGAPKIISTVDVENAAEGIFEPCLESFCAKMPGETATKCDASCPTCYGQNYDLPRDAERWREMYFNCGIQVADWMRQNDRATFFTLGYGQENGAVDPDDPYQGLDDTTSLKSKFLVRLTLDNDSRVRPTGVVEFPYTGYKNYSQALSVTPDRIGEFVPTPTDSDLELMFQRVAQKILLRLVA